MNIKKTIKFLQGQIANYETTIKWLESNEERLVKLDLKPDICGSRIDFNYLPHEKTVEVMLAFPGKWKKTVQEDKIDYESKWEGRNVRVFHGEPPPNCKIVQEGEEWVPGFSRPKYRMVCPQVEKPATETEVQNA